MIQRWIDLIPVTASLSSFEMMMLLLWLNFLVMFLTPLGRWKFWNLLSSMFHNLNPFKVVAQHHVSVLFEKIKIFLPKKTPDGDF